jgi:kynurenine 3-monooxygenase
MQRIAISGAGLAGTMLAIMLARRGYGIDLYERRPDPRAARIDFGRSINLALSARGSHALAQVGLLERVLERSVPMKARAIHSESGEVSYQAFGRSSDEYLSAIERHTLNNVLLDAAAASPAITLHFEQRLSDIDFDSLTLTLQDQRTRLDYQRGCDRLIVAEGAYSTARKQLVEAGLASFTQSEQPHGYKELLIGVERARDMRLENLHLWPRRRFMMIANPNPNRSFSCTLFMPHEGAETSFAAIDTPEALERFFTRYFPDAAARMPTLAQDFFARPTGTLPTIAGGPWHVRDRVLLLGDAAHALVPFFAQGMNSAFEDCTQFIECLERSDDAWEPAITEFFRTRKPNADAIAEMAMQNYREIQESVADPAFRLRKQLEQELMGRYPERYTSMHVLVMFSRVPYEFAQACGRLQAVLLDEICSQLSSADQVRWPDVDVRLQRYARDVQRLASRLGMDPAAATAKEPAT